MAKNDKKSKARRAGKVGIAGSIVGIVIFTIAFTIIIGGILLFYCGSIVTGKWQQGEKFVKTISEEIGDLEYADAQSRSQFMDAYLGVNDQLEAIVIADPEGNILETYGAEPFLPDERAMIADMPELGGFFGQANAFVDANGENLLDQFKTDKSFGLFKEIMRGMAQSLRKSMDTRSTTWLQDEITGIDVWFTFPYGDTANLLTLKYRMLLTVNDVIYLLGACVAVCLLFLSILIYHIVSIVKIVKNKRRIYDLLYMDTETSGYNKLYFEDRGKGLIRRHFKRMNSAFGKKDEILPEYAVVNMTFTRFRSYVACNGVEKGKEILEKIYNQLAQGLQKRELALHFEKADFALLLLYHSEQELNERILQMMQELCSIEPGEKLCFMSGICHVASEVDDIATIYHQAGIARGSISGDQMNQLAWFTDEMQAARVWDRRVENEMEGALERKEFQMYLQPKYTTKDESLGGAEALCRWQHPTEGLIPPYKFIPLFEQNGFIVKLDDYMISEVARHQAKWLGEGKKIVPISVNVSRVHFSRLDLAEHIRDLVDQYQVPHEYVELELTESAFFDDKAVLLETVKKMREYGFPVSMDDFGAGYSSLNSLKELPLDVVKLDAEFFRGEEDSERGKVIIQDTIALARKLGMHIVAEGIETKEQVDFLAEIDKDVLIQGYYYAKPMPAADYEAKAFSSVVTLQGPLE